MGYRIVKPVVVQTRAGLVHYRHPGTVVELTEEQAAGLGDRVELVVEEPRRPRRGRTEPVEVAPVEVSGTE